MPKSKARHGHNGRFSPGGVLRLGILALAALAFVIKEMLYGKNVALFNPQGFIARQQHSLIVYLIGALVAVGALAVLMIFFTAWKYRESNSKAQHEPDGRLGKSLVLTMWLAPSAIMVVLAAFLWPVTHNLEPQKAIAATSSNLHPLTIEVVAMRWKWLFIYPEQHIASVNFVQIPTNRPVKFELTADEAPMSSFWIPNLGGQLYAMTGMVHQLNLMADTPGDYPGSSAEINGAGFAGMKFTARVGSSVDFYQWAQEVEQTGDTLDNTRYNALLKPSQSNPAIFYSSADIDLYDTVVRKYVGPPSSDDHMNSLNMQHEMSM